MLSSIGRYGEIMGMLSVASVYIYIAIGLGVISFALMALKKEPRLGPILISVGYLLSMFLMVSRLLLGMSNYQGWKDLYFKVQIGISVLGLFGNVLIAAGIVLLIYGHVLSRGAAGRSGLRLGA